MSAPATPVEVPFPLHSSSRLRCIHAAIRISHSESVRVIAADDDDAWNEESERFFGLDLYDDDQGRVRRLIQIALTEEIDDMEITRLATRAIADGPYPYDIDTAADLLLLPRIMVRHYLKFDLGQSGDLDD